VIVAIESASSDLSLALMGRDGTHLADAGWTSPRGGGHDLLPRLLRLLERHGHRLHDVSALGVGTGPGSFTGLRVGMALAKGLAVGLGVPLVGVPSLEAWLDAEPGAAAAISRAGAAEAHLLLRGDAQPRIVRREDLPTGVRSGTVAAPSELASAWGLAAALPPLRAATAVAERAAGRLANAPAGDPLALLEPLYLRPPRGVPAIGAAGSG
jgi:tRNA threonylcarbamoyladenosine biosynthesis protein TsaB